MNSLIEAAKLGDFPACHRLLLLPPQGAVVVDVNACDDWNKQTALHFASKLGSVATIKLLLENGAIVDKYDKFGQTSLHIAASNHQQDAVRVLLKDGLANCNATDRWGRTPLYFAVKAGDVAICQTLLSLGSPCIVGDCLELASFWGNLFVVDVLLQHTNGKGISASMVKFAANAAMRDLLQRWRMANCIWAIKSGKQSISKRLPREMLWLVKQMLM